MSEHSSPPHGAVHCSYGLQDDEDADIQAIYGKFGLDIKADGDDDSKGQQQGNRGNDGPQFSSWEDHTKGIASKLIAAMGFRSGHGLGKNKQGMTTPVEIGGLDSKSLPFLSCQPELKLIS